MSRNLVATVRLLWSADTAKEMGLGLDGYFAKVDVTFPQDTLETMLMNEDAAFDVGSFFEIEDPDSCDAETWLVFKSAIERLGNLPANQVSQCQGMGLPDIIDYDYSVWEDEDD